MAKFEMGDGEQMVFDYEVDTIDGGKQRPARLVLTTQRLVLCIGNKMGFVGMLLGRWVQRTASVLTASRITHEIPRERFASVERGDGKLVVFRDTGEGYAHTSFAVVSASLATPDGLERLQRRLVSWASQTMTMPLPEAKLHNSRK